MVMRKYSDEEDEFIKTNYQEYGVKWCADQLGRPYNSVKGRVANYLHLNSRQGQGPKNSWSDDELELLRLLYPEHGPTKTAKLMSRTIPSIRAKAKEFDLHRLNYIWSDVEVDYLTDNCRCYRHIKDIADVLGRSPDAVWLKSKQLKLGCTKPYLRTDRRGIPPELADEVYKKFSGRCAECNKSTSETIMEIHHIIPWKKVKCHELSNLVLLCYKCHRVLHHNSYVLVSRKKVSPLAK
jgi:hypothetical protein